MQKNNWKWVLSRGCLWQSYSSNGTISGNGIILETSRYAKDVPFKCEFRWGDVKFGRYKPTKKMLAITAVDYYDVTHEAVTMAAVPLYRLHITAQHDIFFMLVLDGSTSFARGQHGLFEPILQWVPRYTATRLVFNCKRLVRWLDHMLY